MLFGLKDGNVTYLSLNSNEPVFLWSLSTHMAKTNSSIANILGFDFLGNGNSGLFITRDDGSLELYTYNIDSELELKFKEQLKEGLTGIQAGKLSY